MLNKKSALVLGGTKDMVFAMGVLLLSLKKTNNDIIDEVVIFHDGISRKDKKRIAKIYPVKFIDYEFCNNDQFVFPSQQRFTNMVFSKYECLRLLDEYHTVIWMDYDMLISGDLSELCQKVPGGCKFILTETMRQYLKDNFADNVINDEIDIGVHTSVFALYDCLPNYMELYHWCKKATMDYQEYLYLPEQIIFSIMIKKFLISVYPLSFKLYSSRPEDIGYVWDKYVKIWHCYGKKKFWNDFDFEEWNYFYDEWKGMGGY